jgi:hypothetical protein
MNACEKSKTNMAAEESRQQGIQGIIYALGQETRKQRHITWEVGKCNQASREPNQPPPPKRLQNSSLIW